MLRRRYSVRPEPVVLSGLEFDTEFEQENIMIKKLLAAAALVALGSTSVLAADLAPRYSKAPPPVEAVWSWTGFYFGGHVGFGVGQNNWGNLSDVADAPADPGASGGNGTTMGPLVGLQAGYNWQAGWAVFGIQADGSWTDIKGHTNGHPGDFNGDQTVKTSWLASVTARVGGIVHQDTLVYVKGGAAWTKYKYDISVNDFGTFEGIYPTVGETRVGWTIGLGTEYHFDRNWSGFIEANYYDFGNKRIGFPQGTGTTDTPPFFSDINQRIITIKGGVNYTFNWGAPLVAKY
jgi:outer membrane immunogenic protein